MISAKILAYSRDHKGRYIVSWELEYPRFIHGEFMTHRLFSRNAASSRAIPVKSMIAAVLADPAKPIHWGKNQPGMQADEELDELTKLGVMQDWENASKHAAFYADSMDNKGAHKQIVNRLLEPFQTMKTVMTATCLDNFFWLRNHKDAQPEIRELARLMWEALQGQEPRLLHPGWWHVPYFHDGYWCPFMMDEDCYDDPHTLKEALAISSSCCAQVSYRRLDDTLEKAQMIFQRLVDSKPVHASPFEHQATPMLDPQVGNMCPSVNLSGFPYSWEKGITHVDRNGEFWSGNFIGFIQHRQLLDDHTCWDYKG
jgi:hypothetical protein